MVTVAVCGGRDFGKKDSEKEFIWRKLDDLLGGNPSSSLIITHGNARGVDKAADGWARDRGIEPRPHDADWNEHLKAAGPIRNQEIISVEKPSLLIAFPGGTGTADMVNKCRRAKIPVIEMHEVDPVWTIKWRADEVDGTAGWFWPLQDVGAWYGPHKEFVGLKDQILQHCGSRRGTLVQAGGCCGLYPRLWAKYFDQVHTFEPDPYNFHCLLLNCGGVGNIQAHKMALGDTRENLHLEHGNISNVGGHTIITDPTLVETIKFHGGSTNTVEVEQLILDSLELKGVAAIQLDAEGFEGRILRGAEDTINRCRPVISVETPDHDFFRRHGYVEVGRNVSDTIWVHKGIHK